MSDVRTAPSVHWRQHASPEVRVMLRASLVAFAAQRGMREGAQGELGDALTASLDGARDAERVCVEAACDGEWLAVWVDVPGGSTLIERPMGAAA